MDLTKISVVLPSLDPDEKLLTTVDELIDHGFSDIILINDGSKPENIHYFQTLASRTEVQLLEHPVNRGKGAALKTAFGWFLENRKDFAGVITVDGDGQHHPEDTVACAMEMLRTRQVILGCRDFSLPQVPARSRMGNRITCGVFKVLCGMTVSDTQTGLRAIPTEAVEQFCQVKGDRFEYETNMLLAMKERGIPYGEVKIRTVYIEENKSSHFRAVRDSVRIYRLILAHFFRYILSSAISAVADVGLYSLLCWLLKGAAEWMLLVLPFVGARLVSSLLNFFINKKLVFRSGVSTGKSMLRYYMLALPVLLLQLGLTDGVYLLLHIGAERVLLRTVIYVAVMACLYLASFIIQQRWVFARRAEKKDG